MGITDRVTYGKLVNNVISKTDLNLQLPKIVLTWYNIPRIHCILVLDEAKAIHEFDLRDLARAMAIEVIFNILFGSWKDDCQR